MQNPITKWFDDTNNYDELETSIITAVLILCLVFHKEITTCILRLCTCRQRTNNNDNNNSRRKNYFSITSTKPICSNHHSKPSVRFADSVGLDMTSVSGGGDDEDTTAAGCPFSSCKKVLCRDTCPISEIRFFSSDNISSPITSPLQQNSKREHNVSPSTMKKIKVQNNLSPPTLSRAKSAGVLQHLIKQQQKQQGHHRRTNSAELPTTTTSASSLIAANVSLQVKKKLHIPHRRPSFSQQQFHS